MHSVDPLFRFGADAGAAGACTGTGTGTGSMVVMRRHCRRGCLHVTYYVVPAGEASEAARAAAVDRQMLQCAAAQKTRREWRHTLRWSELSFDWTVALQAVPKSATQPAQSQVIMAVMAHFVTPPDEQSSIFSGVRVSPKRKL